MVEKLNLPNHEVEPTSGDVHVYAGQGTQGVGVGADLWKMYETARKIYAITDQESGLPVTKVSFEGPQELLDQPTYTQLSILARNKACLEVAKEKRLDGFTRLPKYVIGHSFSIFSAAEESGAIDYPQAVKEVAKRGEALEIARREKPGQQIAILGLSKEDIERYKFNEFMKSINAELCANNAIGQIVIGVPMKTAEQFDEELKQFNEKFKLWSEENNLTRVKAKRVNKSLFHTSAMERAKELFAFVINNAHIGNPNVPIISNTEGKPITTAEGLRREFIAHLCVYVHHAESMRFVIKNGARRIVEIGNPTKILLRMTEEGRSNKQSIKDQPLVPGAENQYIGILSLPQQPSLV